MNNVGKGFNYYLINSCCKVERPKTTLVCSACNLGAFPLSSMYIPYSSGTCSSFQRLVWEYYRHRVGWHCACSGASQDDIF